MVKRKVRRLPRVRLGRSRPEWLPLTEAAAELGLTPEGLRAEIDRAEIAAFYPGDSGPDDPVLVGRAAIADYRERRERQGEGGQGR